MNCKKEKIKIDKNESVNRIKSISEKSRINLVDTVYSPTGKMYILDSTKLSKKEEEFFYGDGCESLNGGYKSPN